MAGNFSISDFKTNITTVGGFTRGYYFECVIQPITADPDPLPTVWKAFFGNDHAEKFLCKSTALPTITVNTVDLKYFTRSVKIAGSREVQPFTLTFLNASDYKLREALLFWQETVSTARESNFRDSGGSYEGRYAQIILEHFDVVDLPPPYIYGIHKSLGKYIIEYAFPTSVGNAQFSFDNEDYQTFDVTFDCMDMKFVPERTLTGTVTTSETYESSSNIEPYQESGGTLMSRPSGPSMMATPKTPTPLQSQSAGSSKISGTGIAIAPARPTASGISGPPILFGGGRSGGGGGGASW